MKNRIETLRKHVRRRDVVILGLLAVLCALAIGIFVHVSTRQEVSFFNAFDAPLEVDFGGERFRVDPQGRVRKTVTPGLFAVSVLNAAGEVVDEGPVFVPRYKDVVAYN